MEPGLYPGMDRSEYDAVDALNQTTIKIAYEKSLLHARAEQLQSSEPTEAKIIGLALHTLILEPELFQERFAPMPVNAKGDKWNRRFQDGAIAWDIFDDEHPGCHAIKQAKIDELYIMRASVLRDPTCREIIEAASFQEVSFFWEHPDYGFACKGQADLISQYEGWSWCVDVKSTKDASPLGFSKEIGTFSYMVQGAWYLEGLNEIAEAERRYGFIAFDKSTPFCASFYELDPENLMEGRYRCDTVARKWQAGIEAGEFGAYPGGITQTKPQGYAMTHRNQFDEEVIDDE